MAVKKVKKSKSKKSEEVKVKKKVGKNAPAKAEKKSAKKGKAEKPAKKAAKKVAKKVAEVRRMKSGRVKLDEKNLIQCSPVNEDLKPAWYELRVTTEADGMFGSQIEGRRYVGAIDPDKDERKVADMAEYDRETLRAIIARLSSVTFHATGRPSSKGVPSRLQPNKEYILHCRLAITKENTIKAAIGKVFTEETNKKGRVKMVELDKKDYQVRKLRKVNKYLPVAFRNASMPPKPERKSRRAKAEEE